MSVAMIPGRTSYTGIPRAASRSANSRAAIASPAFVTQYSPRPVDAISAETDVTNTIEAVKSASAALRATMCRAIACVRKYGP